MNPFSRFCLIVLSIFCLLFLNSAVWSSDKEAPHWSYEGAMGPEHWGDLFPECKGKSQSPIDIHSPFTGDADALAVNYKPSPLKIINNGHSIQINYAPGSSMTIHEKKYELVQFHFHKPSEEEINGQAKAMVIHLVHKSEDGKLAVIGVLVNEGKANEAIQTLWSNLPKEEGKESSVTSVTINVSNLLPSDLSYYHYVGSLTTPPCTEGVDFFILKNPIEMSKAQIAAFPYAKNARPVQPLNGRKIEESKTK